MNIFGILHNTITGCEYYRVMQPLEALRRRGHHTAYMKEVVLLSESMKGHAPPWAGSDLILMNRLSVQEKDLNDAAIFVDRIREMEPDVRIVFDTDDDLTNAHRAVMPEGMTIPSLLPYDRVTVTTPYLRKVMLQYHPHVTVLPNFVLAPAFVGHKRLTKRLTIGLSGSPTHMGDWKPVIAPLNAITDKYDCQVFITGALPDGLRNFVTLEDLGLGHDMTLEFKDLADIYAQIDILLIPLDPNDRFTWSKSAIKAYEGASTIRVLSNGRVGGCALIAVRNPPIYLDFVRHEATGLLVSEYDADSWYDAMKRLILNPSLRERLQEAAYLQMLRHHNLLATGVEMVEKTYQNIIQSPLFRPRVRHLPQLLKTHPIVGLKQPHPSEH